NSNMQAISRQLADMIIMIQQPFKSHITLRWIVNSRLPPIVQHPHIQYTTDDSSTFDQHLDLIVCQLTLMSNDRPTIMVTCPDRPFITIDNLLEALIRKMSDIQNDVQFLHLPQQLSSLFGQSSTHSRTRRISSRAIVRQSTSP